MRTRAYHYRCRHCDHCQTRHEAYPGWEPHYDDGPFDPVQACTVEGCGCVDYEYPTPKADWDRAMALPPGQGEEVVAQLKHDWPDWDWTQFENGFQGDWPLLPIDALRQKREDQKRGERYGWA